MKGLLMLMLSIAMVMGKGLPTTTASLATSETVVQTASCGDPGRLPNAISIVFEQSNRSVAWVTVLDETVRRGDVYGLTVSAMGSVTEGIDPHLIIMLPKTTHLDLDHDHVHCKYDFESDGESHFEPAAFGKYGVKKLQFQISADGVDQASLADSSAEIAVKINGKMYVFKSAGHDPNSMEMYSQSAEVGTGDVNPRILYIWRTPNEKVDAFSLTVFAPIDSALAVNAEKYTCRLKVGHDFVSCTPAQSTVQSNAMPTWAIVAIGAIGGTILLIAIIAIIAVVFVRRRRGNRRDPAAVRKDEKKDGDDVEDTEMDPLATRQQGDEGDADRNLQDDSGAIGVQVQQDIGAIGVQVSNGDEAVPVDGAEV